LPVEVFKSGRIKSEFPDYIFETKKKLDVTVTMPLGVTPLPAATPTSTPTEAPASTPVSTSTPSAIATP
jgi:hypothetical protein